MYTLVSIYLRVAVLPLLLFMMLRHHDATCQAALILAHKRLEGAWSANHAMGITDLDVWCGQVCPTLATTTKWDAASTAAS